MPMQFYRTLEDIQLPGAWLTIGTFDGVHRGHQTILGELVSGAQAAGLPAVVLTFDPHPVAVLRPDLSLKLLTTIDARVQLMGTLGVDVVIAEPFTRDVAELTAEEFMTRLKRQLGFSRLLVGYDFAMGKGRSGDIPTLRNLGQKTGFDLQVFDPVSTGEIAVSSSRIRTALSEGDVETAARLLGRPYALSGRVVPGAQRGRTIGIPTANIAVPRHRAVPGSGVYACRVTVAGIVYLAATNIGLRPTFDQGGADQTVEAHILDFDQDIYDEVVQVDFLVRLRGEQKFSGIDALVAQIRADIARTREELHETVP